MRRKLHLLHSREDTTARRCSELRDCLRVVAVADLNNGRNRIDMETWVDAQMRELYNVPADADIPVELDLDDIKSRDASKRADFVKVMRV